MKNDSNRSDFTKEMGLSWKAVALWCIAAAVLLGLCLLLMPLSKTSDGRKYPVYINEVMASNTRYPNADGRCCDYIELYNSADYSIDLTGFQLGDIAGSGRYLFPYGTIMEPGSYLVVYCDKTVEGDSYAAFGISRSGGESFYLVASNNAIVDSVITVAMDTDQPMVRLEGDHWGLSQWATPGFHNDGISQGVRDIYNSGVSPVRISEVSSVETGYFSGSTGCDWVELHNTAQEAVDLSGFVLSDNVGNDKYIFPAGTVIPGNRYLVVCCAEGVNDPAIAPFGLSQLGGETVVLKNAQGMIVEIVESQEMTPGTSMSLMADGKWTVTEKLSPGYENTDAGHETLLRDLGAGNIHISEVMAGSQVVLADSAGNFSDWVELYNSGDTAVNLTGWFLSDDETDSRKWQFPELWIQPGEYRIIYLSGDDTVLDGEIHVGFGLSAAGESLTLSSCLGTPVDQVAFGASADHCSYIFDDHEAVQTDYPTPGYSNNIEGWEQFRQADVPTGELAIWEVMTFNYWYLPQSLGQCYDWVEIRNVSDKTVNLSDYSISDDADVPGMYVLPDKILAPGSCIVILLSGDESLTTRDYAHGNFSLDAVEDQLFLFQGDELLDYVLLRDIPAGSSYGRTEETGGFFYMTPTPGKANTEGVRQVSAEPVSEYEAGVYTTSGSVTVPLEAQGTIYYTLDGSDPDLGSRIYQEPIVINETTVLRAASLEEGKGLSEIYTATFIIGENHSLPVVSLVTDPDNLWGPDGIYKNGDITIKEERRPANLSYTGTDGTFSLDCRINLHGATTVTAFNKKSFTVSFLAGYDGPLYYDLFEDGQVTSFRSLIVRTAHESTVSTQMRDALMGSIAAECSDTMLSQRYKYVALYLNGEYWGLYALRELHSEEHYANYMDVPVDSVTISKQFAQYGTSLYDFHTFCQKNSLKDQDNWEYAKSLLDMSSFVDWIIFESYVGNFDVNGNMRYYYCDVDGLWRCGLVDVDLGMFSKRAFDQTKTALHHGVFVTALMENEEFQQMLATRLAELLSGPLSDENVLARIDEIAATIRDEIPREGDRWGYSLLSWENQVKAMREYVDGRARAVIENLCSELAFTKAEREQYFGTLLSGN